MMLLQGSSVFVVLEMYEWWPTVVVVVGTVADSTMVVVLQTMTMVVGLVEWPFAVEMAEGTMEEWW